MPSLDENVISILTNKKYIWRLFAVACFIVICVIIWNYQYLQGRLDQCIEDDGYLLRDINLDHYKCYNSSYLAENGWRLNKETKKLVPILVKKNPIFNFTNNPNLR